MRFGLMQTRVKLQSPVRTPDGQGGYALTFKDEAEVWAQVTALGGREYLVAQQLGISLPMNVSIRYYPGLAPEWRVVIVENGEEGTVLDVRSVTNPDSNKREHMILGEQVLPSVD